MKKTIIIILSLSVFLALVIFKLTSNKKRADERVYAYDKEQPVRIGTMVLEAGTVTNPLAFAGVFEADRESKLSAETQGKINAIYADEGRYVRRGQALVKIDDALLKHQLQSVNVQIQSLEDDVKRFNILAEAGAIQATQLDKAILQLSTARIQRNTLNEQIRKTVVYAPFDGIITQKLSEVGSFAAPGIPLLQLTDISKLRFTVNLAENDLSLFDQDKIYPITVDAFHGQALQGKLIMIGSRGNIGSNFPVRFAVPNPGLKIKSGMFGKVALGKVTDSSTIIIPSSAVLRSGDKNQVYMVQAGKVYLREVFLGERMKNEVVVRNGLGSGDTIATSGFVNLFEGANVITQ